MSRFVVQLLVVPLIPEVLLIKVQILIQNFLFMPVLGHLIWNYGVVDLGPTSLSTAGCTGIRGQQLLVSKSCDFIQDPSCVTFQLLLAGVELQDFLNFFRSEGIHTWSDWIE